MIKAKFAGISVYMVNAIDDEKMSRIFHPCVGLAGGMLFHYHSNLRG